MSRERVEPPGLAYLDEGEPTRGTVLALHSLGTDHRLWLGQVPALCDAGFRVLAPDARGHGDSDDRPLRDARGWVEDIVAVLDDAGAEAAHVMGVSMGCAQALELALQAPDRALSLLLTGGFGRLEPEVGEQKADALISGAHAAGMQAWGERYAADTLVTDDPHAHSLVRESVAAVGLEAYGAAARACFAPRSGPLERIAVPALIVWGEQDHKTPEEMSTGLADELPRARLVPLPGGGHLAPLDVPERFAEVAVGFFGEASRMAGAGASERTENR